jgi:hypothetical protein
MATAKTTRATRQFFVPENSCTRRAGALKCGKSRFDGQSGPAAAAAVGWTMFYLDNYTYKPSLALLPRDRQ